MEKQMEKERGVSTKFGERNARETSHPAAIWKERGNKMASVIVS